MVSEPQILLLTNRDDTTSDLLVLAARANGVRCFRLNTEDLPDLRVRCCPNSGTLSFTGPHGLFEVSEGTGICYRRPLPPVAESQDSDTQDWLAEQWRDLVEGLEAIPGLKWLSRPSALRSAENKIRQLMLARSAGFAIPPTLVTNDLEAFVRFRDAEGIVVAKALGGGLIGPEVCGKFIYTTAVTRTDEPDADELRLAPVVFQRYLSPATSYRVTVVGPRVFAVRLHVEAGLVDWRLSEYPPGLELVTLPRSVEDNARQLVVKAGLGFSTMDLMSCREEMFFLDLNPNGEWAWLERGANVSIAGAIVEYLARGT